MISEEEVTKLATLARLKLEHSEVEKLRQDLDSILGYVSSLEVETVADALPPAPQILPDHLCRADTAPHEAGIHTARLLSMSPARRGDYFVVKPIFPDDANR